MGNSRIENSKKNIIMSYINQLVSIVLLFVSRTVFIYVLGIEYLGFSSLFADILKMLSLLDLGFTTAMAYTFYKPLTEKDYKKINALINFYKQIYLIIAIAITIIGIAIIPLLGFIINIETPIEHLYLYYLLYLSNTVISYLFVYKTTLLVADQKNYILIKLKMVINVIATLMQIAFLLTTENFIIYLIIMNLSTLFQNMYPSYVVNKVYPISNKKIKIEKSEKKEIFLNIKSVFIYKISGTLINSTDNILISILVGTVYVGYYSNYNILISNITIFVSSIFGSMTASIGNLLLTENDEKKYRVFSCQQVGSLFISGVVVTCFFLLADDFINIWLGSSYELSMGVVIAITANFYLNCIFQPLWSFREASGLYHKTKFIMVFTALLNLIFSIFLGNFFGIAGILFGTVLAKLCTYFWYEPPLLFKTYFKRNVFSYYKEILINALTVLITILITSNLVSFITVSNWGLWFIKAIICGLFSLLIMFIVYYRKNEFKLILNIVKNRKN